MEKLRSVTEHLEHLNDTNEATLRRVANLYSGPFLSSVALDAYPQFEQWAAALRAESDLLIVRLLKRLLPMMLASGSDPRAAVIYAAPPFFGQVNFSLKSSRIDLHQLAT